MPTKDPVASSEEDLNAKVNSLIRFLEVATQVYEVSGSVSFQAMHRCSE